MRVKRLDLRLAILLPLGTVILVGSIYLVHEFQVRRTARNMKAIAEQARVAGKRSEALRQYGYYVKYVPSDYAALSQWALLMAEEAEQSPGNVAAQRQALALLEQAGRRDRDNREVRSRLVDFSLQARRFSDALDHIQRLREAGYEDSALLVKLALCHTALDQNPEAITDLEKAISLDPTQVDAYIALAEVYAKHTDQPQEAEATLARLIAANPNSAKAYLARGRSFLRAQKIEPAQQDLQRARELAPEDLDVLLAGCELASATGKPEEAAQQLQRAAELFPKNEQVLRAQATLQLQANHPHEAIRALQAIVDNRGQASLEQFELVEILLSTGEVAKAREQVQQMKKKGFTPALLGYLDARLAMSDGKWRDASLQLEPLRPQLAAPPKLATAVDLALAQCYERLGYTDLQVEACQRILQREPSHLRARCGHASGLLHGGKVEPAVREYHQLRQDLGEATFLKDPLLRTEFFQALLLSTQQQPSGQRDWSELNQWLSALAGAPGIDSGQLTLMRAEAFWAQDQLAQAYDLVTAECQAHPQQAGLWIERAKLAAQREGTAQGLAVLDEAGTHLGDSLLLRLARIDLALRLDQPQAGAALEAVAAGAEKLPPADQALLWQSLGSAYHRLGERAKAGDLWRQAAQLQPENASLRLLLFELAREMGDEAAMADTSDQLKRLLGSRSAEWNYAEAARRIWKASQTPPADKGLQEVAPFLNAARELRPSWPQLVQLEGQLAVLQGNIDEAIRAFQRARSLGPLAPPELRRLVSLLVSQKRWDEARQLLAEMDRPDLPPDLKRMRAELLLQAGQRETALKMAAALVAGSSQASDFTWYGQFLLQAQQGAEAIAAFRRAVELSPHTGPERLLLIISLIHAGQPEEARAEIEQLAQALPEEERLLTSARAYQILGDRPLAEQQYQAAAAAKPEDLGVQLQLASFYVDAAQTDRSQLSQAQLQLEKILEAAGRAPEKEAASQATARRLLAVVLANRGDVRQQEKALQLLKQNSAGAEPTLADRHAQAVVLGVSPKRAEQVQAIALLEQLQKEAGLNADEQLHLARLYDLQGNWPNCRQTMLNLLASHSEPRFLLAFLQMLFQHETPAEEIEPWLHKLLVLRPKDPMTTVLEARWLAQKGDTAQAVARLQTLIPRPLPEDQLPKLAEVALLLEELQQPEQAQTLLEEYAASKPEGKLALARFLARQNQSEPAWQACQAVQGSLPLADLIGAALDLLALEAQHGPPSSEHVATVDSWLQKLSAEKDAPEGAQRQCELLLSRLRELQGRADDLVAIYQHFLERPNLTDLQRAPVWNNLAYVLAVGKNQGDKALAWADQAIAVLGPAPELLDTRAMAHLAAGKPSEAIRDLREALEGSPNGLKYFHLALAQVAAGDPRAACDSLQTAHEKYGFSAAQVPPLEQTHYGNLMQALPEAASHL